MGLFTVRLERVSHPFHTQRNKANLRNQLFLDRLPIPQDKMRGRKIGEGAFANVYAYGRGRAAKLCFPAIDPAYMLFIRNLSKMKVQNPHFPIIYDAAIYTFSDKVKVLSVEMERLYVTTNVKRDYNHLFKSPMYGNPLTETAKMVDFFVFNNVKFHRENYWLLNGNKDLFHAWKFLRCIYLKHRVQYDLVCDIHGGNVMLRRDGTPVVTDPFAA